VNTQENMARKENGIIFGWAITCHSNLWYGIPACWTNLALWTRRAPNYIAWFTNGGIEIN
jgi:hypothetical protein